MSTDFDNLCKKWEQETSLLSSTTAMLCSPAAVEIQAMGVKALPMLMKKLQEGGFYFLFIERMFNYGPVIPEKDSGKIKKINKHYLKWCLDKGYVIGM